MPSSQEAVKALALEAILLPQEELFQPGTKNRKLFIGIPKEIAFQENRVAMVPSAVEVLVSQGHRVVVESHAGKNCKFTDKDYTEAGAEIVYSAAEVFQADLILKVAPPTAEEVELLKERQTIISALQLSIQPKDILRRMMAKKVTAVAWEFIKDEEGIYPAIRAMGEIAGSTAVLIAAEYLSNVNDGPGLMFGGISGVSSTEVVIIGAGTVGEFAARAALGLGASVRVFDDSIYRLRRLQNDLGMRLNTSIISPSVLEKALIRADVAIGALRAGMGRTPCVVSENMVAKMKPGSVIVDISIDQGGCFETSEITNHSNPVINKYGVIHYGVPNIASRVARTASFALSNIFTPIVTKIGDEGGITNIIKHEEGFRHGV
ncbi:MAG TPA: alanine dehydrogenase, partial [Luteibaculaceae bacterium]|nr:alanine dehydrogenase [Luteibaculaceae bacterium]